VVGLFDKWDCAMEERELAPGDAVLHCRRCASCFIHARSSDQYFGLLGRVRWPIRAHPNC
jgi:hypothetical protein